MLCISPQHHKRLSQQNHTGWRRGGSGRKRPIIWGKTLSTLLCAWIYLSVRESSPVPASLVPVSTFRDHIWLLTVTSVHGHTGTHGDLWISNLSNNVAQMHGNHSKHKLRRRPCIIQRAKISQSGAFWSWWHRLQSNGKQSLGLF